MADVFAPESCYLSDISVVVVCYPGLPRVPSPLSQPFCHFHLMFLTARFVQAVPRMPQFVPLCRLCRHFGSFLHIALSNRMVPSQLSTSIPFINFRSRCQSPRLHSNFRAPSKLSTSIPIVDICSAFSKFHPFRRVPSQFSMSTKVVDALFVEDVEVRPSCTVPSKLSTSIPFVEARHPSPSSNSRTNPPNLQAAASAGQGGKHG